MSVRTKGWCACWIVFLSLAGFGAAAPDSPLADAVKSQNKDAVRALLQRKVDVNAPQPDGATALAWASYWDDSEIADLLIRAGADANAANDYGVTSLSLACTNGSAAMVDRLLKAGASPNLAQRNGQTPLMTCARTGSPAAVRALLDRGADINARETERGQTAVMAATAGNHPDILQVLIDHGADVQVRTRSGFTALMFAAQQGNLESMQMLLAKGANVNDATATYGNVLTIASASHHESAALFILEKGADPNVADSNGVAPLHYALARGIGDMIGTEQAVFDGHYKVRPSNMPKLAKALLAHGANVKAQITGNLQTYWTTEAYRGPGLPRDAMVGATPYLLAAIAADVDLMRAFLAAGADPWTLGKGGITPLVAAAGGGWNSYRTKEEEASALEAVKLVVELGANVNETTAAGQTAMHAAAYTAADSIIQFLADKGAELDMKTRGGETPWTMAAGISPSSMSNYAEHKDTADLLVRLGGTPLTPEEIAIVRDRGFRALSAPR